MYNIIPLILILASLAIIITIVVRKFSVLANLDLNAIPTEREAKFKEKIISNRIKRNYYKYYTKLAKIIKPAAVAISGFFGWAYEKLIEFKENYNRESASEMQNAGAIPKLFAEAEDCVKTEDYEKAEEKLIKIIGIDSKNIKAFKVLGRMYYDRKDFNEAKQTFEHVLKLLEQDSEISVSEEETGAGENKNSIIAAIYFELSLVNRAMDNPQGAIRRINQAVKIEPNNPRFLDTKFEISIINKDKISALEAYEKLAEVNPENKKLGELKKQIEEL